MRLFKHLLDKLIPKQKVAAAPAVQTEHPLLAMKRARDASVQKTVGLVYGANGTPKISPEWARALTLDQRIWVDKELASRGLRISNYDTGTVEELN